jgi:hypothetical protein
MIEIYKLCVFFARKWFNRAWDDRKLWPNKYEFIIIKWEFVSDKLYEWLGRYIYRLKKIDLGLRRNLVAPD